MAITASLHRSAVALLIGVLLAGMVSADQLWTENHNLFFKEHAQAYTFRMTVKHNTVRDAATGSDQTNIVEAVFDARVFDGVITTMTPVTTPVPAVITDQMSVFNRSLEQQFYDIRKGKAHEPLYNLSAGYPRSLAYSVSVSVVIGISNSDYVLLSRHDRREALQEQHDRYMAVWRAFDMRQYHFTTWVECGICESWRSQRRIINVDRDTIVGVYSEDNTMKYPTTGYRTIEGYFLQMQAAIDFGDLHTLVLEYDREMGFPRSIAFHETVYGDDEHQQAEYEHEVRRIAAVERKLVAEPKKDDTNWAAIGIGLVVACAIIFTIGFFAYKRHFLKKVARRNRNYDDDDFEDGPPPEAMGAHGPVPTASPPRDVTIDGPATVKATTARPRSAAATTAVNGAGPATGGGQVSYDDDGEDIPI